MEALFFIALFVGIGVYFKVQDIKRRDIYDPSYLIDLYNGTLNSSNHTSTSHHRHYSPTSYSSSSRSSRSSGSRSRSRSSSGRGGGGRGSGGGAGRR